VLNLHKLIKIGNALLAGLFLMTLMAGCKSVAPGMQIQEYCCEGNYYVGSTPCQGVLRVIEITPELVCELECESCLNDGFNDCFSDSLLPVDYKVGPSDILNIMVWGHPELNNPTNASATLDQLGFVVNGKGVIYYPYIGDVYVAGKTVDEIREILTDKLRLILVRPVLSVKVLIYRSQFVNVIGEVNLPASIPLDDVPMTPLDAISKAGGATFAGDLRNVVVKRNCELCIFNMLPKLCDCGKKMPYLKHGDIIYVPNKVNSQVYVLGEFKIPQSIVMDADSLTLSDAIARSAGLDVFASNPKQMYVFREDDCGEKIAYHLDATSPAALILANRFALKRQDIIYVGTYRPAILNRIMTNFLSTTRVITDLSWSASNINEVINKYNQSSFNNNNAAGNNDINNNDN
jgi:polysaccharide export outer membrane protein